MRIGLQGVGIKGCSGRSPRRAAIGADEYSVVPCEATDTHVHEVRIHRVDGDGPDRVEAVQTATDGGLPRTASIVAAAKTPRRDGIRDARAKGDRGCRAQGVGDSPVRTAVLRVVDEPGVIR